MNREEIIRHLQDSILQMEIDLSTYKRWSKDEKRTNQQRQAWKDEYNYFDGKKSAYIHLLNLLKEMRDDKDVCGWSEKSI